jgi:hypothetical protein
MLHCQILFSNIYGHKKFKSNMQFFGYQSTLWKLISSVKISKPVVESYSIKVDKTNFI